MKIKTKSFVIRKNEILTNGMTKIAVLINIYNFIKNF